MAKRLTYTPNRVIDENGISDGADFYVYETGTTTLVSIYSDSALTTPLTNPFTVASGAAVPTIYHGETGNIRVRIVADDGSVPLDEDPYFQPVGDVDLAAVTAGRAGTSLVGVEGGGDVQDYIEGVSANAFSVVPDTALDGTGYPTTAVDQAANLQAAVDYAASVGASRVFVRGQGAVVLGSTIEVPFGITIDGLSSRAENASEYGDRLRFVPLATGEFATAASGVTTTVAGDGNCSAGFLFMFNVDPADTSTWVRGFPNVGAGGLQNCSIDGTATGGISVCYFAGSHTFENVRCTKVATFAQKPTGVYTDAVKIRNIFGRLRANGTDYLINLPGNGDAYDIADIHSGYTGDQTGVTKALFVGLCRSGTFHHVVNGISEFKNCMGTVSEFHIETGQIIIDAGHMKVGNSKLYNGKDGLVPLVIRNTLTTSNLTSGSAIVEGNNFIHSLNSIGDVNGWAEAEQLDILCEDSRMDITIDKGNRRTITTSGELSRNYIMAPLIGNSGGVYAAWERHAHWLALTGTNINNDVVDVTGVMQPLDGALSLTAATYTPIGGNSEGSSFAAATATYFYSVDVVADPYRKLGRTGAEVSQAATLDSATLPVVRLGYSSLRRTGGFIARVYRGTATGNYTQYVDIPLIECKDLIDDGLAVNGYAWKANPSAPSKITLNNNGQNGTLHYRMGLLEGFNITNNSNPAVGTWLQGDRLHIASTVDHEGRLCTVAGTPGTWVKLGIKGAEKAAAVTLTYAAPAGGATVDAEARTALGQNATDIAAIKASLVTAGLML